MEPMSHSHSSSLSSGSSLPSAVPTDISVDPNKEKATSGHSVRTFHLKLESELRLVIGQRVHEPIVLVLRDGTAEVFGFQLVVDHEYKLYAGSKLAVFTWIGCTVEIKGSESALGVIDNDGDAEVKSAAKVKSSAENDAETSELSVDKLCVCSVNEKTPMVLFLDCHASLECLRRKGDTEHVRGPILMVVGPTDVGKSTLCRILVNYAVRSSRCPVFVDIDVGQGQISIPGTMGARFIEQQIAIDDTSMHDESPLIFHFGHTTPSANLPLYNALMDRISAMVKKVFAANKQVNSSGMVINTCGWVKNGGYRSLIHAAKTFEVDAILVLDQERLYNELVRDVPDFIKIIFVPRSPGARPRGTDERLNWRLNRIHDYLYGPRHTRNAIHTIKVRFDEVRILSLVQLDDGDAVEMAPPLAADVNVVSNEAPTGDSQQQQQQQQQPSSDVSSSSASSTSLLSRKITKVVTVEPTSATILNRVLSISPTAATAHEDDVSSLNVLGFVVVSSVNEEQKTFTVMSPVPGPLPYPTLLLSEVEYYGVADNENAKIDT